MRRILRWTLIVVPILLVVALLGGSWYYSDRLREDLLTPPKDNRPEYDVRVIAVGEDRVTLERTEDSVLEGTHGLEWPEGYAQIEGILSGGPGRVEREFTLLEGSLGPGERVHVDRWAFPGDPEQAFGIAFDEVAYPSELGAFPAWLVEGTDDTWVIFVHGKGATRREALRMLEIVAEMGHPSLVITYRNDPEARPSPDGRYHLGESEWRDLEGAVEFALDRGAADIVLVGYSMGGAIVTTFLLRSELAGRVRGAILDAPVLDWGAAVDLEGENRGLPQVLTSVAKWISALRFGIDWDALDKLGEAERLEVPILLFHGGSDDAAPIESSDRFAAARPDLVTYRRVPGAEHVGSWNVDPASYEADVGDFLKRVAS
jgi:pimeloyl-ACP methyl ester carboxylesterase